MLADHQRLCSHALLNWTLGPTVRGALELRSSIMQWVLVARKTVLIGRSGVNIMAQGLFTPDPSLSPTHLSIRRGRATTTHHTHHQVSLMVSHNTTLVPSLGLCIGQALRQASALACEESTTPKKKDTK